MWTRIRAPDGMRVTALLICTCGALYGCHGGSNSGDVRSVARETQCRTNLRALYEALVQYASLHGDVPRTEHGEASIDALVDPGAHNSVNVTSAKLRCPVDKNPVGRSYLLNPALSVDDLGSESPTIVACDRLPHHIGVNTHNSTSVVLLGDGATVVMDLPLQEQEEWRQLFEVGDKRACRVSSKDGTKGNWTSSNIIWYIGQGRGYVPNE